MLLPSSEGKSRASSLSRDTHLLTTVWVWDGAQKRDVYTQLLLKETPGTPFGVVSAFWPVKMRKIRRKQKQKQKPQTQPSPRPPTTTNSTDSDNKQDYIKAWLELEPPRARVRGKQGEQPGCVPQQGGEGKWDLTLEHLEVMQEPKPYGMYTRERKLIRLFAPFPPLQIFVPHTWVHNFLQDGFKHVSKYQIVNKNMFGNKRPIRCKTT